jgi:hypothetical protein
MLAITGATGAVGGAFARQPADRSLEEVLDR